VGDTPANQNNQMIPEPIDLAIKDIFKKIGHYIFPIILMFIVLLILWGFISAILHALGFFPAITIKLVH